MNVLQIKRLDVSNKREQFLKLVADIIFQYELRMRISKSNCKAA